MPDPLIEGTVVENRGAHFEVLVDGQVVRCLLRGRLKKDKRRSVAPVAAGDQVRIALLEPGRGVIEDVLPRDSGFSRTAAGSRPLQQTLVANVDQAVIVFAAAEPRADLFLLDRFLVAAIASELDPLVCINKTDLVDGEPPHARFAVYRQCGFRVLFTSAESGDGVGELRAAMKDRRSVFCGPSGVGKSSLINALAPGLHLKTAEIGDVTHKGRHATTSVQLIELPFGGWVADTAGLRQLSFVEGCPNKCPCDRLAGQPASEVKYCPVRRDPNSVVEREHIAAAFPDVVECEGRCRFRDCAHGDEPGCAVREAVATGELDGSRARSYGQMRGR
jgi:ribosome biogenesis GTPase